MTEYILSNGTLTSDYSTYLKDAIELVFDSEKYSIPGSDLGFEHSLSGVDKDLIDSKMKDRVEACLKSIDKDLSLESSGWDKDIPTDYNIVAKLKSGKIYEITINL